MSNLPESIAGFARPPRLARLEALAGLALALLARDPVRWLGVALVVVAVLRAERARSVAIPVLVAAVVLG